MTANNIVISHSACSNGQKIDAICLGSGRFLRSVLVPFLSSNSKPAIFQTRGRTFLDSFVKDEELNGGSCSNTNIAVLPSLCYPVDTIEFDGNTTTSNIDIYAAGSLGTPDGKSQLMNNLLSNMNGVSVIGVGVTEAGMQSADNQCMMDLTQLLYEIFCLKLMCPNPNGRICIVNTDNVPNNGDLIRSHISNNAIKFSGGEPREGRKGSFGDFIRTNVAFLNSMVDRITSSRPNSKNGLVPLCEPLPAKALVICDPGKDLPRWMLDETDQLRFGVKIRQNQNDLDTDISLKLRVANGTHTAVAHVMALLSLTNTEALCDSSSPSSAVILSYLDSLYETQILPGAMNDGISKNEADATWDDWRQRLMHPKFGLSTFFITQNGAAKCGIRLGPTIRSLVTSSFRNDITKDPPLSVSMAFAVAAILRFLTPASCGGAFTWSERITASKRRGVHVGYLDNWNKHEPDYNQPHHNSSGNTVTYADGLKYSLSEGWYEFRCDCLLTLTKPTTNSNANDGQPVDFNISLPDALSGEASMHREVVREYLLHSQGGNLQLLLKGSNEQDELQRLTKFDTFVGAVTTLYSQMLGADSIVRILKEMMNKQNVYTDGFATTCACL